MLTLDSIQEAGRTLWLDSECIHDGCLSYLEVLADVAALAGDAFTFDDVSVVDPSVFEVTFMVEGREVVLVLENGRDWLDSSFFGGLNTMLAGERRLWILPSAGQEVLLAFLTAGEAEALRGQGVNLALPPNPVFGGPGGLKRSQEEAERFLAQLGGRLGGDVNARLGDVVAEITAHLKGGQKGMFSDFGTLRQDRHGEIRFRAGRALKQLVLDGDVGGWRPGHVRAGCDDQEVLRAIAATVVELLLGPGGCARVPGLGVFRSVPVQGGRFRLPATGEMIEIADRRHVHFKAEAG